MRLEAHARQEANAPTGTFFYPQDHKGLSSAYSRGVDWMGLREVLRAQRAALGETLDELAVRAGLDRSTIHSIENVKREPSYKPKIETVEKLALAMDLKMSDLFRHVENGTMPARLPTTRVEGPTLPAALDDLSHAATTLIVAIGQARQATEPATAIREPRRPATGRHRRRAQRRG